MFDEDNYPEAERDTAVRRACYRRSTFPAAGDAEEDRYEEDSPPTLRRPVPAADCTGDWSGPNDSVEDPEVHPGVDPRGTIVKVCNELRDFLLEKNDSYGNSAFEPLNVFSQLPAAEGILIRIDDKLKRIRNGRGYPGDNDLKDLTGYLILLMVLMEIDPHAD